MDIRSSSSEQDVDSVCSDDGTNIDNPGEKYTGTPKKVSLVEKGSEEVNEADELSSSESDDTLVVSSSESDAYHDVDTEGNRNIDEVLPLDTRRKNEVDHDNTVNSSEDLDKRADELSDIGQDVVRQEAISHVKDVNDDRHADEPAFETKRDSIEESLPPDLSETTSNEDESRDLEVVNIPTEEVKGYVNDIIEGACNELRNVSVVDNNNGNEPDRHACLNDISLNEYDIVSLDEPTAMGEGASKIERDLSKDPSIPADISDLTEGESTGPTGDPVVIIDYKKRKFSNDDEDPILDENEKLVDSFVKKLKRDELVEDQQVPEYESIPKDSASCPKGLENDESVSKEHIDATSLPNYEDESIQGPDVTCTPSDDDVENAEEYVEVVEKENRPESEAQQPPSDVPVDSESNPGEAVSDDIEELPVVKAVVESDFSPCAGEDEFQSGKQHENSFNESVIDVLTDDIIPEVSVEEFASFTPPEENSNESSEPSIIIDYESKERVSEENNTETDEEEKLVDNFVENLKLNIKDENTGSDISSEELDEISQGTNSETTVDDVHGRLPSCENIHEENPTNDVEENICEESVGNSDSLRDDEKSSSELVNFLSECLDLEDTGNDKESCSSISVIGDQPTIVPVQEQFDVQQKLTPETPNIENFLNEIHNNQTVGGKPENKSNDNELQPNDFPRKYSEEEVRRAIHILTSKPPYDDLDPEDLYEKFHDPKFDRVFALVLAPKPKETKTRMFGLFSNPVLPPTDDILAIDLNEDDENVPYLDNGSGGINLSDHDDEQITAENETEIESRPDIPIQYIIDVDDETMDVEDDNDDDGSSSSSSASSGMYVLEEYSAIKEEVDDEQTELQNYSSNDDERSDFKMPTGSGKMFCVTTIPDASKQNVHQIAGSENVPVSNNFSSVTTDSVESPSSKRNESVLSSDGDLVNSPTITDETTALKKEGVVETEVRIIHLSDDMVEYDVYLLHQAQNTGTIEQASQKEDSTNVEQLFTVKDKVDDRSALSTFTEDDQNKDVELNVFIESNPVEDFGDAEHGQNVDEESVVPTNIQRSAFDPQTVESIEWETPFESENNEKKYDFSFKVTTPTYITFEENVLPPDYEDRFVTEAEVVPNVLDPDESCPFNFDLNDKDESKLINEPQMDVILLGSDQKTSDESVDRQELLDNIADILNDNADEEQSDAESIDSHPPHFVDKQELPMEDPYSTHALVTAQPLDLTAYLPDTTGESNICPGGSSFIVVGTPCKTNETVEVPSFVARSESSPYTDYAENEEDEIANTDDVGEQLSSSSESLSSTENSDNDSYDNANDDVPYEQFENDLDYANEGTPPTIVSDIPLSMPLPLDQLSNASSSSGNDEEDFNHSFPEGLDDDLQGNSSGRKSSSSSSSCSSNNTAQEPGVSYEYLEEGNDDDSVQSNSFESKENTSVNGQESQDVPDDKDENAILADSTYEDPEDLDSIQFQVLLENETPRRYENPMNDNLTTSDSDSAEPIVMTVYHDQHPRNNIEKAECKLEEHIDSHRAKETESVPLIPDEHVTFNMYLVKPPLEESPIEYDEYLELQPKDSSENLSEPEIDESNCMAPRDDVPLSENCSKDSTDPDQSVILTSDSDDVTPPRHRCESSSAASAFSDSDVQDEPSTNGPSVVFALIGRPSLDNLHDPELSDDHHSGGNFDGIPELRDDDGSPELPVVFQGSVEVFRDESLDEVQVGSVTNFQEICHNNQEDEQQLSDSEISHQNIVYHMERETHIVHQSVTTIEVSRSMSPS